MRWPILALSIVVLAACAASPAATPATPAMVQPSPPPSEKGSIAVTPLTDFEVPWPVATPEQAGLARPALERLVAECQKTDSDALLVLAGDHAVVARSFGHVPRPLDLKSVTKGFVGFAIGFLLAEGKVSLDDPLSTWFPEWKGDARKSRVLLRHVLTHTSGLAHEPMAYTLESHADRLAYVRGLEVVTEPGAVFSYNNEAAMLLSGVIARAAGEPIDSYLARRLFEPLGITDASWSRDGAGNVTTNGGLSMSAVSLAKVGMAVRDGRVVPSAWIAAMQQPSKVAPWVGMLTWTLNDDPQQVQDAGRRAALQRSGFSAAAKLAPLDGKPFRSGAAYWLEAGALLSPQERAALASAARHELTPLAPLPAEQVGFFWDGWLGQFLVVLPKAGVVAVRQRAQPPGAGENTDSEVRVKNFTNLVRLAATP